MDIKCAVCSHAELSVVTIGDARRGSCAMCLHEQRIDIEHFDYIGFAMGGTGGGERRLRDQAVFITRFLRPGTDVLEIGCAAGQLARLLRTQVPLSHYCGIEFSPAATIAAETLDAVYRETLPALMREGRIGLQSQDFIISSHCLEHIVDVNKEIACAVQALRPDGRVFIEVPNRSGHFSLPFDDNRSHLHFFSVNSLSQLLACHGLWIIALETGAWHDSRYPDCIRVVASISREIQQPGWTLSDPPHLASAGAVIIWGAGKMVQEMLAHFFDPSKILFFVDKDTRKHGTSCMGRPVRPPEAILTEPGCTVLINTIEFESAVRTQLAQSFTTVGKVIAISELLGGMHA